MHKSIAAVDLKPTVFAGVLRDSRRRKLLAGWCCSMSDAAGSWEVAKGEKSGCSENRVDLCLLTKRGR